MTNPNASAAEKAWAAIESERRRDTFLRGLSIAAWAVTLLIVLLFGWMVGIQVAEMWRAFNAGVVPWMTVVGSAMPLLIVVGFLSLLIATLATVGIFLRLRTASLTEIQLRLAALEDMLAARHD
jgi:hypothetical protein